MSTTNAIPNRDRLQNEASQNIERLQKEASLNKEKLQKAGDVIDRFIREDQKVFDLSGLLRVATHSECQCQPYRL